MTFRLFACVVLGLLPVAGCDKDVANEPVPARAPADDNSDVDIDVPGANIRTEGDAPGRGVNVDVGRGGVDVDAPGADVEVPRTTGD